MNGLFAVWSAEPGHDCPAAVASGLLAAGENWTDAVESAEQALASPACGATAACVSRALGTLVCAGELVAADAHSLALLERGDPVATEIALLGRACVARRTGDLARCSTLLARLRRNGIRTAHRSLVLLWTVQDLIADGDPRAAEAVLCEEERASGDPFPVEAAAEVALALGRPRDALAGHLASGRALLANGIVNPAVVPWRSNAARAALACGEHEQAARLAGEEHAAAVRWGEPRALGVSLAAVARTGPRDGEDLAACERAIRLLELAHARADLAAVLCDYGDLLGEHGKEAAAGEVHRRARAVAADAGLTVLVRRADEALRAAEAHGRAPVLTAAEAEVARLVRLGLSTRQIAARLAMATRTVELHLTRVYRKLGLSGRRELRGSRWFPAAGEHR
ncbi:DNA-binding transcriptional regulator, CsgD family [Lentzea fradiae]|uniref:DNA-binding transcriptional regulator, CsgD family n=1 Tax=Lentzea fradiae TaxID=200378 RepID=A0A1G7ZB08_9PSEU|nr:helix-turn-helix transcriptional regulator [Lentzea fradiae]SDH05290.1 DNA-binding transcriptional regulator, CsgD family [Lentzea fradiae]